MNESGVLKKVDTDNVPLRLLFVDDLPDSARLMAKAAMTMGHDAAWATSEAEAKAILAAREVDGLITDYYLEPEPVPGGGARLAAFVHSGCRSTPCIVITGFSPAGELRSMTAVLESMGDVVVLHKPQDPRSLMSIIRSLQDAKHQTVEVQPAQAPIQPSSPVTPVKENDNVLEEGTDAR